MRSRFATPVGCIVRSCGAALYKTASAYPVHRSFVSILDTGTSKKDEMVLQASGHLCCGTFARKISMHTPCQNLDARVKVQQTSSLCTSSPRTTNSTTQFLPLLLFFFLWELASLPFASLPPTLPPILCLRCPLTIFSTLPTSCFGCLI